jgi:L-aspartate oxidase
LSRRVGVERDRAGLVGAIDELHPLAFSTGPAAEPAFVGLFIAIAALTREESRGAHSRTDYLRTSSACAHRRRLDLGAVAALAGEVHGDKAAFAFGD